MVSAKSGIQKMSGFDKVGANRRGAWNPSLASQLIAGIGVSGFGDISRRPAGGCFYHIDIASQLTRNEEVYVGQWRQRASA
jgi:hypothetical protein